MWSANKAITKHPKNKIFLIIFIPLSLLQSTMCIYQDNLTRVPGLPVDPRQVVQQDP